MELSKHEIEKTAGPWREAWNGFRKSKVAVVGMVIVFFFILLAIFGTSLLQKKGINEQVLADRLLLLQLNIGLEQMILEEIFFPELFMVHGFRFGLVSFLLLDR